jgi:hypothetical protein
MKWGFFMTQSENGGRYGIGIRKYCAAHEAIVTQRLESGGADGALLRLHGLKIAWLQHERLIHLIVLVLIAVLFLFSVGLFIALMSPLVLILVAIALALLTAYIRHYFYLENTVQSWYVLYDRIYCSLPPAP